MHLTMPPPHNFNPLRPWGRRPAPGRRPSRSARYFNPLRPWGRRLDCEIKRMEAARFQPTPPVGAETPRQVIASWNCLFQPTPPVGAETFRPAHPVFPPSRFQPTPPVGAETMKPTSPCISLQISTHSARGGGDPCESWAPWRRSISTHSARGGGDPSPFPRASYTAYFNPLRPWGRRPPRHRADRPRPGHFNPLRPWGRRPKMSSVISCMNLFQPTPPVGAETFRPAHPVFPPSRFQPTPPVGAETYLSVSCRYAREIFQPTPPVGAETTR